MVMPGWSLEPIFYEYAQLFPMTTDHVVLAAAQSKTILFERLLEGDESRANLPCLLLVDFDRRLPTERELEALPASSSNSMAHWGVSEKVIASFASVTPPRRAADLNRSPDAITRRWSRDTYRAVVQAPSYCGGEGRTIARMMHLRLHEMPHTGGASSLRRTWWHESDDARQRVKAWMGGGGDGGVRSTPIVRQPEPRLKGVALPISMSAPLVASALAGLMILVITSSLSNPLLAVVPAGMWAKASIFPPSELAREAGEAEPVGNADRPHIHRPSW